MATVLRITLQMVQHPQRERVFGGARTVPSESKFPKRKNKAIKNVFFLFGLQSRKSRRLDFLRRP